VKPRVSIVVPCHNEEYWLPKLLMSLNECNTYLNDIEIVVVDNGSTDRTIDVLWAMIPSLRFKVRLTHESRKGVSYAKNTGSKVAQADILVFIDSDIQLTQRFVNHLWSVIRQPDFGGATIRTLAEPGSIKGTFVFWVLELIKLMVARPFGKSVATRDAFEAVGGFACDVKLGENVIFTSRLKQYVKQRKKRFYHISSPVFCSLRRFEIVGYTRVLRCWLVAYLGSRHLPYETIEDLR
jgi:glycosyltransferase involved in cell wall biosynthesis